MTRVAALCLVVSALLLSSCIAPPISSIQELSNDVGDTELLMEPVDVWDKTGADEPQEFTANGKTLYYRVRSKETFERAYVRLGLFWHSRQDFVYMPMVIVDGPPIEFKSAQIVADGEREKLKPAKNFSFTPPKRPFDKELHSTVFTLTPEMLGKIASSKDASVIINTNRGGLRVNLSAVTEVDDNALANSVKYQFADFYQRMRARQ